MEIRAAILPLKSLSIVLAVLLFHCFSIDNSLGKQTSEQARRLHDIGSEQELKLRRIEEAAALFIQRWHETLDLEPVFNEMYVSNALQRRRNIYSLIRSGPDNYKKEKNLDPVVVKDAFMAFFNMMYLDAEYSLTQPGGVDRKVPRPPEVRQAIKEMKKLKGQSSPITIDALKQLVRWGNYISSLYRPYLTAEVFNSSLYQENLRASIDESEPPRLLLGVSKFDIGNDQEAYVVKRGVFEFCFIEEDGRFKILTLRFWED